MKTWINTVQNCYVDMEELGNYDEMYNICFRAGYTGENRVKQMWNDNKVIDGSVNPEDFGLSTIEEIATLLVSEYQEAIEFTESNMDGMPAEGEFDYAPETIEKIKVDLIAFMSSIGMQDLQRIANYAGETFKQMFAYDFWLTRNGHGSGFWDSVCWGEFQDLLTSKAKESKESDAYIGDDGLVYLS
jgi:hypothetical protein